MDDASGDHFKADERFPREIHQPEVRQPAGLQAGVGSRGNAVKHGLTAGPLLPAVLGPEILAGHRERFAAEWRPCTPTESHLVDELARHAAALERATPIEEAILRTSARRLGMIADGGTDEDQLSGS